MCEACLGSLFPEGTLIIITHTTTWIVLMPVVPRLMPLMMHQSHLHQRWRLDRWDTCNQVHKIHIAVHPADLAVPT